MAIRGVVERLMQGGSTKPDETLIVLSVCRFVESQLEAPTYFLSQVVLSKKVLSQKKNSFKCLDHDYVIPYLGVFSTY